MIKIYQILHNMITKNESNEINLVNFGGTKSHILTTPCVHGSVTLVLIDFCESDKDVLILAHLL